MHKCVLRLDADTHFFDLHCAVRKKNSHCHS